MAKTRLSKATGVVRGYGQVEPNHLSAQRNGQIYAQLPAAQGIQVLENGQFAKYDYANGVVNFTGEGEWMLVLNEVKLYRDHETYNDFAMKAEDYNARVYSPIDGANVSYGNARNYEGFVNAYEHDITSTTNPFVVEKFASPKLMPEGTTMVPRVFKTSVGDIFTTNCVNLTLTDLDTEGKAALMGKVLAPNAEGILSEAGDDATMKWQVVKVYTLADRQPAVKLMRIA